MRFGSTPPRHNGGGIENGKDDDGIDDDDDDEGIGAEVGAAFDDCGRGRMFGPTSIETLLTLDNDDSDDANDDDPATAAVPGGSAEGGTVLLPRHEGHEEAHVFRDVVAPDRVQTVLGLHVVDAEAPQRRGEHRPRRARVDIHPASGIREFESDGSCEIGTSRSSRLVVSHALLIRSSASGRLSGSSTKIVSSSAVTSGGETPVSGWTMPLCCHLICMMRSTISCGVSE